MTVKVITRATCYRCVRETETEGAEGTLPPVGWAQIDVTVRHAGPGWTNNTARVKDVLCEGCTNAVMQAARGEAVPNITEVAQ